MGNVVRVNVNSLKEYSDRLDQVNNRLAKVDRLLDVLRLAAMGREWSLLLSADYLVGSSRSLRNCSNYLRKTASDFERVENYLSSVNPRSFQKPSYDIVTSDNLIEKVGNAVKVQIDMVTSAVSDTIDNIKTICTTVYNEIKYSYENGGFVYKAIKVGGQVVQIGLASLELYGAVAELAASGGTLAPLAVAQMVNAANKIMSGSANLTNMAMHGDFESNVDVLRDIAGGIGQNIGGDLGRALGESTYYGFSFCTDVASLGKSVSELTNMAKGQKITDIVTKGKAAFSDIMHTNVNINTFSTIKGLYEQSKELQTIKTAASVLMDSIGAYGSTIDLGRSAIDTTIVVVKSTFEYVLNNSFMK